MCYIDNISEVSHSFRDVLLFQASLVYMCKQIYIIYTRKYMLTQIVKSPNLAVERWSPLNRSFQTSRKHPRTKVTPDFHLTYIKIGEIWGRDKNDKNGYFSIFLHKIICCGCVVDTHPKHMSADLTKGSFGHLSSFCVINKNV